MPHIKLDLYWLVIILLMAFLQELAYRQDIKMVVVSPQVACIDLLITISNNFRLLIKSKTNQRHGDQLQRYGAYAKAQG